MVLADYDEARARLVQARLGGGPSDAPATTKFPAAFVDAGKPELVAQLARQYGVDLVVNAADPRFVPTIFDGAFAAGADYLDMAVSLTEPHPTNPFNKPGVMLGDYQFPKHEAWKDAGRLAILGLGMDPGPDRRLRGLRGEAPPRRDRRTPRSRRRRPLHRRLRVRPRLLHLDHDRGVPQRDALL